MLGQESNKYQILKGILFVLLWYFSIWAGFLFICCPLWPFILVMPKVFLPVISITFSIWEMYPVALMNLIFKIKIRITGDRIDAKESSILIVNHRTRIDWNFLWALMYYGCEPKCHRMKIALKAPLRHMPSLGWVMQIANCMYLKRKWEEDEVTMGKQLKFFKEIGETFQMLLFPEGTDFCESNMKRSNAYAAQHNLPLYTKVLHPKTTGFVFFVNTMRNLSSEFGAIYDLTLAYTGSIPATEKDMLMGNFPKVVNVHIRRYKVSEVPKDKDQLKQWINDRWMEKEQKLLEFDDKKEFFNSEGENCGRTSISSMENTLYLSFVFWTFLLVLMFFLFCYSNFFFWWTILQVTLFVVISYMTDGFQQLCVSFWEYTNQLDLANKYK